MAHQNNGVEYFTTLEINGVQRTVYPMIFQDANVEDRFDAWAGALNGNTKMGCSINVLRFLDTIDDETANASLLNPEIVHPQEGTSIETIIAYFNNRFREQEINRVCVKYFIGNILTPKKLTNAFNMFSHFLQPNSCIIVRFGRAVVEAKSFRPHQDGLPISAGHYVIVAKRRDGSVVTFDPQNKSERKYNQERGVSHNFWNAWSNINKYINISILCVYDPTDVVEGGSPKNTRTNIAGPYVVPPTIMNQFGKALLDSYSCSEPSRRGGKTRRRHHKTRTTRIKLKTRAGTKRNP